MKKTGIDYFVTIVPFLLVLALVLLFFIFPLQATDILGSIRGLLNNSLGIFYLIFGLFIFLLSLYMAFSRYGNIKLGSGKKEHSDFAWGTMMFTAGLAADILFYSLCEWMLYANQDRIQSLGDTTLWSATYPLFHWGPIPWAFYVVLASCFGFMLHVRKRTKAKYSEGLRVLLGSHVDGVIGKIVDLTAVFALIAGTATTFSLATPLLSQTVAKLFGIGNNNILTIAILLVVCLIYSVCAYLGIDGVSKLASCCTYLFFALLLYVFFGGGHGKFILELGFKSLGNLANNFLSLATYIDPTGKSSFAEDWTVFYWAWWVVYGIQMCIFLARISRGRTVRELCVGMVAGLTATTWILWTILGSNTMHLMITKAIDLPNIIATHGLARGIIETWAALPLSTITIWGFFILCFIATVTLINACSYTLAMSTCKEASGYDEPPLWVRIGWSILVGVIGVTLLALGGLKPIQTAIIAGGSLLFFVNIIILVSFFKDAKKNNWY